MISIYPSSSPLPIILVAHTQLPSAIGLSLCKPVLVDTQFATFICQNPIYLLSPRPSTLLPKATYEGSDCVSPVHFHCALIT